MGRPGPRIVRGPAKFPAPHCTGGAVSCPPVNSPFRGPAFYGAPPSSLPFFPRLFRRNACCRRLIWAKRTIPIVCLAPIERWGKRFLGKTEEKRRHRRIASRASDNRLIAGRAGRGGGGVKPSPRPAPLRTLGINFLFFFCFSFSIYSTLPISRFIVYFMLCFLLLVGGFPGGAVC